MTSSKQAYIATIRANTAYPTYRGIIGIITVILMVLAGLQALGALVGCAAAMQQLGGGAGFVFLLFGLAAAALAFFMARFWNEAALILADIGDSIMEANAHATPTPTTPAAASYYQATPPPHSY